MSLQSILICDIDDIQMDGRNTESGKMFIMAYLLYEKIPDKHIKLKNQTILELNENMSELICL